MRRAALGTLAVLVLAGLPAASSAQPIAERDVPPALKPWSAWVREEIPDRVCTAVRGAAVCVWPGRLDLRLTGEGGSFSLDAYADRALDLRLPGDGQRWPQDVRLDGHAAAVIEREAGPALRLPAGTHRIDGRFVWTHLPDSLPVPPRLGLVDLSVAGRSIPLPRRDEAGLVWLRTEGESAGTAESLRLQAFRKVTDGIPIWVETRLSLEVSGKAREVELTGALIPGTTVVAVSGDLPARIDEAGRLRIQVRAGAFSVTVLGRLEGRPSALARPPVVEPWPAREVWVFAANETLRQVELSGLQPVDPSRTDLPADWRALPAFLVEPAAHLALKEVRRGEAEAAPDRLRLHRELWLDVAGGAFTVRDRFSGALSRTWRLDLQRPAEPGRVSVDSTEQLITANPANQAPGVELRRGALQLEAESRIPRSEPLRAVGWSADVEQLGADLHLPPGWSLLAATGVDRAPGAWTGRWNLLAFFFVLIVALAMGRLFGRGWGVVALFAVVFAYDEPGAPFLVWLSLLGATALSAVAPQGWLLRLARFWRGATLLVLLVILVPFVRDQVREALYPQTREPAALESSLSPFAAGRAVAPAAPPPAPVPQRELAKDAEDKQFVPPTEETVEVTAEADAVAGVPGGVVSGVVGGLSSNTPSQAPQYSFDARRKSSLSQTNAALEQDPRAVVQTGPGVPSWTWSRYGLGWTGPVKSDQTIHLWLVSPGLNRLWTFLRLFLVLLLAVRLLIDGSSLVSRPSPAVAALALLLFALVPRPAGAQDAIPDHDMLEELKNRLARLEPCQPSCISTSALHVRLAGDALVFEAEVHAADAGAWPLPGPPGSWAPTEVRVDGQVTGALARLDDGFLYVRVSPGVHRVRASGTVPRADTLTLQLPQRPRRADADTPGWDVAGLRADGPPDGSIQLSRRLRAGERAREESGGGYAPWLEVTRTLSIGLTWRVHTDVHRVSPTGAPIALRVPLLAGEEPTEADLQTENGVALVSLARDQTDAGWSSTLATVDTLALKAPEGQPWSEVWRLECSVIWQCEAGGLVPVSHQSQGVLAPEFRPWPGESLTLRFRHPQAVAGRTLTLQSVRLETTPGERLTTTTLTLTTRASREEPLVLTLPGDAEVQDVIVSGRQRPGKPDQGRLRVTLPAGAQTVIVKWREARGMSLYERVPTVGLPVPAVNVETVLHLPENRWLLFTRGPAWGPAVLFWGYLFFAVLVALGLGLFADTPLGIAQWLLLVLGLTQTTALGGLVVAGLFLAIAARARRAPSSPLAHDAIQVLLVAWILVALAVLYDVVQHGLVFRPDMQVAGAESSNAVLRWYADRVERATPAAGVVSLPLFVYRILMLAWALWLAASLVRWAGWSWRALGEGGLWRPLPRRPRKARVSRSTPAPPAPDAPAEPPVSPSS
jgi:hypothetical protein